MLKNAEWNFYALRNDNLLVIGFTDAEDAKQYCKKHKFRMFTRNGLKNKMINPHNLNNWIFDNEVPEY